MGVIGVGNPLAGDDGAGPAVVAELAASFPGESRLLLQTLDGDLFALADSLPLAPRFFLVDAVCGRTPGRVTRRVPTPSRAAASLHQNDLAWVLGILRALGQVAPFPETEVFAVTIWPPEELRESLSPPVESAVRRLADRLARRIRALLAARSTLKI